MSALSAMAGHNRDGDGRTQRKPRHAAIDDCNDLEWVCWHNISDILFAGDKDGMVWMWLIGPSGVAQSKVYAGNGSPCTAGHMLPDGKRLLAGYGDGILVGLLAMARLSCSLPILLLFPSSQSTAYKEILVEMAI
ncbi:unnamed protein product [Strongylus vulgaris]|uniref:Uncharacterized protein n=1 Tax=Strongylus vulgaris TaxID=40348 RepID=A0A3P7INN6_STRVU|nr:unnamed protein product [Strongylus vulgaris]